MLFVADICGKYSVILVISTAFDMFVRLCNNQVHVYDKTS